jgi:tRNA A-37 threonylcarbamoyl transferase component Bud32
MIPTPTYSDLTAAIRQFRDERMNPGACDAAQAAELEKLSFCPPNDLIICKDGSRSLVGKYTLPDGTECVLKYYYPKNLAKKINYGLRGSRCMRSWIAARSFDLLGIPTATPIMIHEEKRAAGIMLKQSFLACRLVPGIPLHHVTDEASLREVAAQLKEAFATMASFRISHGDLKPNNIIVDTNNRVRFIDLDGATLLAPENKWRSLWERDRARFLKNWPTQHPAHEILSGSIKPSNS